jgi:hypothetical protein
MRPDEKRFRVLRQVFSNLFSNSIRRRRLQSFFVRRQTKAKDLSEKFAHAPPIDSHGSFIQRL